MSYLWKDAKMHGSITTNNMFAMLALTKKMKRMGIRLNIKWAYSTIVTLNFKEITH